MPQNSVMDVQIIGEYGFDAALLGIATNKKMYERDMYNVAKQLAKAGGGHNKFLEFITLDIDYNTCRSIHQQIDTYRIGVTKSSESTHHKLIEDVLNTSIDYEKIYDWFTQHGFIINTEKLPGNKLPVNATALLISKNNNNELSVQDFLEFTEKYLINSSNTFNISKSFDEFKHILNLSFKIDYNKYYTMFEGGSDSITKDMIDKMVAITISLEENRYEKLHRLKRMLPEGFLQRRIMHCNYKVIRTMLEQRLKDPFVHWQEFLRQILMQVMHPEFFEDILEKYGTSLEEIKNHQCNGKPYGILRYN